MRLLSLYLRRLFTFVMRRPDEVLLFCFCKGHGMKIYKKLTGILLALAGILVTGLLGYSFLEGWSTLEALYMTVITLSSVGFMEVHPLSNAGRIFTMLLILLGSGVLIYGISVITAFVVEGELTDVLRRRSMEKKIAGLHAHYIICGVSQTGRYVIDELLKTKKNFVVIEKDPGKIKQLITENILCIEGDATHDAVLMKAGIQKAKGAITALHSDAENLFVVITAKSLNPALRVISKAVEEESEQKIRMVGADGVVMPNYIGGLRMASELIRPSVVGFLDIMLRSTDHTIRVEEIEIAAESRFAGRTLQQTGIPETEGVTVVALKDRTKDTYVFNPSLQTVLSSGHVLIVIGNIDLIRGIDSRQV
ncbi:MAG: potassium channel protein [Thermodesulfovibrio sp.]|nr:potassium channel protein [Thermodesulfovibrio sp.]